MTEEKKQNQENRPEDGKQAKPAETAAKSGLIKYVLFAVVGLVVVTGIAFGTLMLLGNDSAQTEEPLEEPVAQTKTNADESAATEPTADKADETDGLNEDSILALLDSDESVLEELLANIEVLDFVPDGEDFDSDVLGMSVEDSIQSSKWLKTEEKRLADWEATIEGREKELNVRESKVQQQILRIEQAESSRIAKLAKLYDGMDPRAVAQLAANLDDATVVALLPRMKLKAASSVLALLPPARAAHLSKQMITIAEN